MRHLIFAALITTLFSVSALAKPAPYTNECEAVVPSRLCTKVGKKAYLRKDNDKSILGTIVAVAYKNEGDPIEIDPNLTATKGGPYYVIDTDGTEDGQIVVYFGAVGTTD